MAVGSLITKSNFSGSWVTTYSDSTASVSSNSEFYFVCCPSFVFAVQANKRTGQLFPTHPRILVRVCYWSGSDWIEVYDKNYLYGGDSELLKIYHNRSAETPNGTYNYVDTNDSNHPDARNHNLWVIATEYHEGPSSFTGQNVNGYFGGAGLMTNAEYNNTLQGKLIKGNGRTSNGTDGFVLYKGKKSYWEDWRSSYGVEARNYFNTDLVKGSPITNALQGHLIQQL